MSLAEKLRAYLADKDATWADDAATWSDAGAPHLLVAIEAPLTADKLVDAHVRAIAQGARLTVAHAGAPTPIALRTAALFGITLLDASALPEPEPAPAPIERAWAEATQAFAHAPAPLAAGAPRAPPSEIAAFPLPPPGFFRALERPALELADAAGAFAAFDALAQVPPQEALSGGRAFPLPPAGFFRALERVAAGPAAWAVAGEAAFDPPATAPPVATPVVGPPQNRDVPAISTTGVVAPGGPALVVAASAPDPVVAHEDPGMPWDLSLSAPEPEPVHVEAAELAAMPWNLNAEQHELLPAGRGARFVQPRPSAIAQDWGLPWPRPVVPTSGLSIQDPRVWHAQQRIEAVREDLDRIGAPSFGAAKPEGSTWLKRLSEFP